MLRRSVRGGGERGSNGDSRAGEDRIKALIYHETTGFRHPSMRMIMEGIRWAGGIGSRQGCQNEGG